MTDVRTGSAQRSGPVPPLDPDRPESQPDVYAALRSVPLGTVRTAFSPAVHQRSAGWALGWLAVDLTLYAAGLTGVFVVDPVWARLVLGLITGLAVACLFIWAHDAAHGSLFRSDRWSELLGTAAMLPSLQMYRLWVLGHNRVHHGFTSLSPIDWIWRPLTPEEYRQRSRWVRAVYRVERHPAGCGLHYLLRVWWPGMVRFRPAGPARRHGTYRWSKLVTLTYALAFGGLAYRFAGGWVGVVAALVLPFVVFTYVIALVVYLHHTHPQVPFFLDRREWSPAIGQLACTTVVRSNRLVEALTHNILIHTPHHVDSRIPFYRLKGAYADLQPAYGHFIHEYRLRWRTVRAIFRTCQLYEFDTRTWRRFSEVEEPVRR